MSGDAIDPPARNAVLVFGNEGAGVSEEIAAPRRAARDSDVRRVESLNVASSAAILLARSYALRSAGVPAG